MNEMESAVPWVLMYVLLFNRGSCAIHFSIHLANIFLLPSTHPFSLCHCLHQLLPFASLILEIKFDNNNSIAKKASSWIVLPKNVLKFEFEFRNFEREKKSLTI